MKTTREELARLEPVVFADGARCAAIGVRRGRVHYALWTSKSTATLPDWGA